MKQLNYRSRKSDLVHRLRKYEAVFVYLNLDVTEIINGASVEVLADLRQQLIDLRTARNGNKDPVFTVDGLTETFRKGFEARHRDRIAAAFECNIKPAAQQLFSLRDIAEFIATIQSGRNY